ncbi:MAG: hypothetical protein MJE66_24810 [Proteobacteria bacterium]|nr:hypothetical protein [Pseudomonadota bacterium]
MSAGRVFQEALRLLQDFSLPEVAVRDVVAALEANRSGPLQFLVDATAEAGLTEAEGLRRSAAVFFCYAAGQLADDLCDSECTYLENPSSTGPSTQFLLESLFFATLGEKTSVSRDALTEAARQLAIGTGPQHAEVRARHWTEPLAREVAEGIAGRQIAAYLQVLWDGTPLAEQANTVGRALGIAAHVATDIRTDDRRFYGLSEEARGELVEWARQAIRSAREAQLESVEAVLRSIEPVFESRA